MAKWPLAQPLELDPNFPREGIMSWEEQAYGEGANDPPSLKARPVEIGETWGSVVTQGDLASYLALISARHLLWVAPLTSPP